MTFSIVAADPDAGEVGVAVQSKFLACAALVSWARGGVGAVATQAFAEVTYGPRGLDLLEQGLDPGQVIDRLVEADPLSRQRQVGIVDATGRSASFTGTECFEHAASRPGERFAAQGNILANDRVVPAIAEGFLSARGPLAERMIGALRAGQREGGDRRGQEAAGLYVAKPGGGYGGNHDRYIDLRVDHHDEPIEELARLLELHHLYFQKSDPSELVEADEKLETEIRSHLDRLGKIGEGADLWASLSEYMGWENLEERWAGPGRIDPLVLDYLRRHAGAT